MEATPCRGLAFVRVLPGIDCSPLFRGGAGLRPAEEVEPLILATWRKDESSSPPRDRGILFDPRERRTSARRSTSAADVSVLSHCGATNGARRCTGAGPARDREPSDSMHVTRASRSTGERWQLPLPRWTGRGQWRPRGKGLDDPPIPSLSMLPPQSRKAGCHGRRAIARWPVP
jgi:hypothetical protein